MLCTAGGISDALYILLVGELGVYTADDLQVASLKPVNALGVGAITGQPRLAALKALKPSRVLVLRKAQLDRFFRADPPSCSRIYRNFIHILSEKVNNDNVRLRDLQGEQELYHSRLAILQRQLKVHQQRLHFTLEFISRRGFMDYARARAGGRADRRPGAPWPAIPSWQVRGLAGFEGGPNGGPALAAEEELPAWCSPPPAG